MPRQSEVVRSMGIDLEAEQGTAVVCSRPDDVIPLAILA